MLLFICIIIFIILVIIAEKLYHISAMNIYEEIKVILVRSGKSMSKVLRKMKEEGHDVPFPSNLSKMFISGSIRYRLVEELLDYLGYELKIVEKKSK